MRFIYLLFLLFIIATTSFSQDSRVRIKVANDQISFIPPDGFLSSKSSSGFINPKSASSILLYQINSMGYLQYLDSLNQAYFDAQNLAILSEETIKEPTLYGKLITSQYLVDTLKFNRVFFITGSDSETTLFLINYPSAMEHEMNTIVMETIRSIKNE
jgi:hypothetical protein